MGTYLGEERAATSDGALLKGVRRKETVASWRRFLCGEGRVIRRWL
ncbi:hypothetical protein ACR6HW_11100 [Fusibacter sp. JL298sf-3]